MEIADGITNIRDYFLFSILKKNTCKHLKIKEIGKLNMLSVLLQQVSIMNQTRKFRLRG
jgi:hypothetical protein